MVLDKTKKRQRGQQMIYLEYFTFPDSDREFDFFLSRKGRAMTLFIPFRSFQGTTFAGSILSRLRFCMEATDQGKRRS